jgi:uncharacterized protein (TIGR02145 family)/uncharacterized repeat protein (TIGR02543 family)
MAATLPISLFKKRKRMKKAITTTLAVVITLAFVSCNDNGIGNSKGGPADRFVESFINYTLTVNRNPTAGGTVSPSAASTHKSGTRVTVKATPASGYRFTGWTGAPSDVNTSSDSVAFNLNSNVTMTANFTRITHTLTVERNPATGGSVTRNPEQTHYDVGTQVTVKATPASGYRFTGWSGVPSGVNTSNDSVIVTMNTNLTLTANFTRITHTLTVERNPTAGGTVSPSGASTRDEGSPVSITATASSGYRFVNWTVTSGTATFANANNAATTVTLSSNATIRANFQRTFTLTINRNPTAGGSVTPASVSSHDSGAVVNITATAASGYRFVNWTVTSGTAIFANANDAVTTVALDSNTTITANFQRIFTLTITQNPTGGGTFTPASGQSYDANTPVVNITATAASGYRFVNWTVTSGTATFANANNAATTVTLSSNATIMANFQLIPGSQFNPNITYGSFSDSRDGKTYRTVRIGTQTWMAENLNFNASGSVCYNNNTSNCDLYGRLYDWNTVMAGSPSSSSSPSGVRGVCPAGWHVPSDAEWTTLTNFVGSNAGAKLRSRSDWHTGSGHVPGTDDFGFSALPGGFRWFHFYGVRYDGAGYSSYWWSATEDNAYFAWYRGMYWVDVSVVDTIWYPKTDLFSVRCLRDD